VRLVGQAASEAGAGLLLPHTEGSKRVAVQPMKQKLRAAFFLWLWNSLHSLIRVDHLAKSVILNKLYIKILKEDKILTLHVECLNVGHFPR
jgi:hypothetical protein